MVKYTWHLLFLSQIKKGDIFMPKYVFRVHKKACADVCVTADDAGIAREALEAWMDDEDESADFHNAMDNHILIVDEPTFKPAFEHVSTEFYIDAKDFVKKQFDKYMLVVIFPTNSTDGIIHREYWTNLTCAEVFKKLEDFTNKYDVITALSRVSDVETARRWNNTCMTFALKERK